MEKKENMEKKKNTKNANNTGKIEITDKQKNMIKILIGLIGIFIIVALVVTLTGNRYSPSEEVVALIEESPESLVGFRSALGAFEASGGNGNEIILTTEVENYVSYAERAAAYGRTMADVIDDVLHEGEAFFVERANNLRDEMGVEYVRLTIVYRGNNREITRASFYSE